jgi:uncharacterized membrane protein
MSARKALGLGAISGLRSTSGPAFVSRAASRGELDLGGTRLAFLGSTRLSKVLLMMALGEFVGDKLPMAPSRTTLPSLLGRAASGGLVGAALFVSEGRHAVTGAALGAPTAVAAAFAGEGLRAFVGQKTGVPNPVVALAEDAVVVLVGSSSSRNGR